VPKTEVLFPWRQGYAVGAALAMGYGVEAAAFAVRALPWVRVGATLVLAAGVAFTAREVRALSVWMRARRSAQG
jgi:hypothetical protein